MLASANVKLAMYKVQSRRAHSYDYSRTAQLNPFLEMLS